MSPRAILGALMLVFAIGVGDASQQRPEARQVLFENEKVRVRKVILEPGIRYREHTHELPHVGVVVRGGILEFHGGGQLQRLQLQAGTVAWQDSGLTHRIFNAGKDVVELVEVELKQ